MGNADLSRIISFTFDYIWLALKCVLCTMCTYLCSMENVSGTGFYANHGYVLCIMYVVRCALFYVLICVFDCVKIMPTTLYQIDRHTGFEIEIEFLTASKSFEI